MLSATDQQSVSKRLVQYVSDYRRSDWKDLYNLVSKVGRGGLNRETFVAAMKAKHGRRDYADMPDLREFKAARPETDDDGIDIYGCAKATREGEVYTGIAVIHAVREQNTWAFTGWRFTEFPNEPCAHLHKCPVKRLKPSPAQPTILALTPHNPVERFGVRREKCRRFWIQVASCEELYCIDWNHRNEFIPILGTEYWVPTIEQLYSL